MKRSLWSAVTAATLAVAAAVTAGPAAGPAAAAGTPPSAAGTAPSAARPSAVRPGAPGTARTVVLINGERLVVSPAGDLVLPPAGGAVVRSRDSRCGQSHGRRPA
jgi:hypothetical protein